MSQPKSRRKEPRVVFSLGIPMSTERKATKMARRGKMTRNAYIVAAVEEKLARDEKLEGAREESAAA
jgi:hypothetical protein